MATILSGIVSRSGSSPNVPNTTATYRVSPIERTPSQPSRLMPMYRFVIIFALLGPTLVMAKAAAGPTTEEKVRFSVAAITGSYMDEFVAIEKGYHRAEGLSVEMIRAGGGIATQALIAGDLHFSTSAGSALTAMLRGAEIKVIYTNIDRP